MSNLLVLSEVNCSDFFRSKGIYPDEFYTDFLLFKNKSSSFVDSDIFILFAGSCSFSKRRVLDIVKVIQKRADDPMDTGVRSLTIFTDIFLPSLKKYYKFQGKLRNISEYSGWKMKVKNSDIWDKVPRGSSEHDTKYFLTSYDRGDVSQLRSNYINSLDLDKELRGLIKKPTLVSD